MRWNYLRVEFGGFEICWICHVITPPEDEGLRDAHSPSFESGSKFLPPFLRTARLRESNFGVSSPSLEPYPFQRALRLVYLIFLLLCGI
jgi:hypothetical protein